MKRNGEGITVKQSEDSTIHGFSFHYNTSVIAWAILFIIIVFALADGLRANFVDSRVYYESASGRPYFEVRHYYDGDFLNGYCYAAGLQYTWYPVTPFAWNFARLLTFAVGVVCLLYVADRFIRLTDKAWVYLFMVSFPLQWQLSGSNWFIPMLAMGLNPITSLAACLYKPPAILFVLTHWFLRRGKKWNTTMLIAGLLCSTYFYFGIPHSHLELIMKYRGIGIDWLLYTIPCIILLWKRIEKTAQSLITIASGSIGVLILLRYWLTEHFYMLLFTDINH